MITFQKRCRSYVGVFLFFWLGFVSISFAKKPVAFSSEQQKRYQNLELFQKVLHFVERNYVDPIDNEKLVFGAIKGMLETLDPHSSFLPPEIFSEMKADTSGKFGGLGIEITLQNGILTIVTPIEDTPAWRAGLKAGDRIVKITGESTKGMSLMEAVSKMRGKRGTRVTITIYREGLQKLRDVTIVRDVIKIRSVKSQVLEPRYGYVRLTSFNEQTTRDLKKAVRRLERHKHLKGLILDLRNNPGGLLDQAVGVASFFLKKGKVVSTIGRNKDQKEIKHVLKGKKRLDIPLAVLVNSATASAAEIVAGALQDYHRAIILGQTSFGKGSVQTVIELGRNMGLKLTIARYYTPSGRSIQEKGVQPDIYLDAFDPSLLEKAKLKGRYFREKDLKGHIKNGNKKKKHNDYTMGELSQKSQTEKKGKQKKKLFPTRLDPKKDYQVQEALRFLKFSEKWKKLSTQKVARFPNAISEACLPQKTNRPSSCGSK